MGTIMYFSGVESKSLFNPCIRAGAKNFLVSFYYAHRKREDIIKVRKKAFPDHKYFVDSGAYTLQEESEQDRFNKMFPGGWEDYLQAYHDFILKYKDYIEVAVELDVENLVGYSKVLEWQDKYFKPLEDKGIQIIYVWHPSRGMDELEAMCKRHSYIGVARGELKEAKLDFSDVEKITRQYFARVHGFGITSWTQIKSGLFYSVDSTTYLVGQQYGEVCTFRSGEYFRRSWKELEPLPWFRDYVVDRGYDYNLITSESLDSTAIRNGRIVKRWEETTSLCAKAFVDMVEEYEKRIPYSYWDYLAPSLDDIKNMTSQEAQEWLNKLRLVAPGPLTPNQRLEWISSVQRGDKEWLSRNAQVVVDDYLAVMGDKAPSILDPDNYTRIRIILNSKVLPRGNKALTRSSRDLIPVRLAERRTETGVRRFNRKKSAIPTFER